MVQFVVIRTREMVETCAETQLHVVLKRRGDQNLGQQGPNHDLRRSHEYTLPSCSNSQFAAKDTSPKAGMETVGVGSETWNQRRS